MQLAELFQSPIHRDGFRHERPRRLGREVRVLRFNPLFIGTAFATEMEAACKVAQAAAFQSPIHRDGFRHFSTTICCTTRAIGFNPLFIGTAFATLIFVAFVAFVAQAVFQSPIHRDGFRHCILLPAFYAGGVRGFQSPIHRDGFRHFITRCMRSCCAWPFQSPIHRDGFRHSTLSEDCSTSSTPFQSPIHRDGFRHLTCCGSIGAGISGCGFNPLFIGTAFATGHQLIDVSGPGYRFQSPIHRDGFRHASLSALAGVTVEISFQSPIHRDGFRHMTHPLTPSTSPVGVSIPYSSGRLSPPSLAILAVCTLALFQSPIHRDGFRHRLFDENVVPSAMVGFQSPIHRDGFRHIGCLLSQAAQPFSFQSPIHRDGFRHAIMFGRTRRPKLSRFQSPIHRDGFRHARGGAGLDVGEGPFQSPIHRDGFRHFIQVCQVCPAFCGRFQSPIHRDGFRHARLSMAAAGSVTFQSPIHRDGFRHVPRCRASAAPHRAYRFNPLFIGTAFATARIAGGGVGGHRRVSIPYSSGRLSPPRGLCALLAVAQSNGFNPLFIGTAFATEDYAFRVANATLEVSIPYSSGRLSPHLVAITRGSRKYQVSIPYSSGRLSPHLVAITRGSRKYQVSIPYSSGRLSPQIWSLPPPLRVLQYVSIPYSSGRLSPRRSPTPRRFARASCFNPLFIGTAFATMSSRGRYCPPAWVSIPYSSGRLSPHQRPRHHNCDHSAVSIPYSSGRLSPPMNSCT